MIFKDYLCLHVILEKIYILLNNSIFVFCFRIPHHHLDLWRIRGFFFVDRAKWYSVWVIHFSGLNYCALPITLNTLGTNVIFWQELELSSLLWR